MERESYVLLVRLNCQNYFNSLPYVISSQQPVFHFVFS